MYRVASILVLFVSLVFSSDLLAQKARWADLVESKIYKIDRSLELVSAEESMTIKAGREMRLIDFKPLPMINVFLAEFKVLGCKNQGFVSDMIIVEVEQPGAKAVAVGVDMAEKCVLEVFLENKDYYSQSIFN